MRSTVAIVFLLLAGTAVGMQAQAFPPPPVQRSRGHGTRIGLFGFGMRAGADFNGSGQLVVGATLDLGDLVTPRLRVRPSGEIGAWDGPNTYAGSAELLYRFTADNASVTPYAGGGIAIAGHSECSSDSGCPSLWVNGVVGVEVRFRSTFNWLLEYHPMDAFRHNRFYLGLTTRRGS
jgi:hypothetical protein